MSPNLDAVRLKERREIAYFVSDFLQDSDAVATVKSDLSIPWRIRALAEMAFLDGVERRRQWGYLPYMHDGCSLVKKGGEHEHP